MITREQVVDLQPGDVVEVRQSRYPEVVTTGPVREIDGEPGALALGVSTLRYADGLPPSNADLRLTVVSRAPRPLYVNHPRTEPVPGDVVREEDPEGATTWLMDSFKTWQSADSTHEYARGFDWPLRLLVDGETGQVVP